MSKGYGLVAHGNWGGQMSGRNCGNKPRRKKPVILLLLVTYGPKWYECEEREKTEKKKNPTKS